MNAADFAEQARTLLRTFVENFQNFFSSNQVNNVRAVSIDDIATNFAICTFSGILIQDIYLQSITSSEIRWLDRAVGQVIFWVSCFLLLRLLVYLCAFAEGPILAFRAIFMTMPIAFVCGAYVSSIGYFVSLILKGFLEFPATALPSYAHAATIILVVSIYLPRQLRIANEDKVLSSRMITAVLVVLVTIVYALIIWHSHWR